MPLISQRAAKIVAWCLLVSLVGLSYLPGLSGGFVFDDDVNILQNTDLRIGSLGVQDLWGAATSGHAGPLGRPVALLTFALNYYWAGALDAFQFKLINVVIHLINALLVGIFSTQIAKTLAEDRAETVDRSTWVGLLVAAIWALHPLNLTAVLYVVQRMTSLCTLFGLAALIVYVAYRRSTYSEAVPTKPRWYGASSALLVVFLLGLSALSKETGVLFAPLILWTEFCVFNFRYRGIEIVIGKWRLRTVTGAAVALFAILTAILVIPGMVGPAAYANREFTLIERLLTESRAMMFYLRMLVLPQNSLLSLYHDDFELSQSLLTPVSTALSVAVLISITSVTWAFRKRVDVLWFGWIWFLISHALESTIFPLELVYEHRNYFAIIGPLLALVSMLTDLRLEKNAKAIAFGLVAYAALFGFITHVRSMQWSNTVDWAALEVENRPTSMRANYELARSYIVLLNTTGDEKYGQLAHQALTQAEKADPISLLPLMGQIQLAYMQGSTPARELIARTAASFQENYYRNVNTAILSSLVSCQVDKKCRMDDKDVLSMLHAAASNPRISTREKAEVLKLSAQYRINVLKDWGTGVALISEAIHVDDTIASRLMYAQALAMTGRFDDALSQLQQADKMDRHKMFAARIRRERENIEAAVTR